MTDGRTDGQNYDSHKTIHNVLRHSAAKQTEWQIPGIS